MSSSPQLDAPSDDHDRPGHTLVGDQVTNGNFGGSAESSSPGRPASSGRTWRYRIVSILFLSGLGFALFVTRNKWEPAVDAWIRPVSSGKKLDSRVPLVTIATAKKEAVSQFINCLGTVTAFKNVIVRSRVDGELIDVAFQEGQMIQEGQRLAQIDPRAFDAARDQAQGQLNRDLAALELARLNYERSKNLASENSLSQQERDEIEGIFRQAEAAVEVSRAALASAELQREYSTIISPINGRVGLRVVDQGNMIQANDPRGLAVITQLQPIAVIFPIPQDEIPRVQGHLETINSIPVYAYDRSFQNLLATGYLSAIDNQVDPTTGTLRLKAVFPNLDNALFPNQFVNIRLLVREWEDAIVIPSSAIQRGADSLYVWVAQEDSTADIAHVTVAFNEGGKTVIESGLDAGQIVVTEGTDKLRPQKLGEPPQKIKFIKPEEPKR